VSQVRLSYMIRPNKVKNLKLPIPSFALLTSQQAAGYYGNFQDGSSFIPIDDDRCYSERFDKK